MIRNAARMVGLITALVVLGVAGLLAGCASRPAVAEMPDAPRLVGGGMMIAWTAPGPGTVYLIEKRTGKLVETRSMKEGDLYSFTVTSVVQADEFEQMLGISFGKAQFQLFFEPARAESATGEPPEPGDFARTWNRS